MRNKFIFPVLLSADSVLRSKRNSQLNQSTQTELLHGDIDNILSVFLWNLLPVVPWADINTHATGLIWVSQDVKLMISFSAGLAKAAHSTAAQHCSQNEMGWECVVRGYGRTELGVLGSDQCRLHSILIAAFNLDWKGDVNSAMGKKLFL